MDNNKMTYIHNPKQDSLTGLVSRCKISCGHMDGVSAEKGPPGCGENPSILVYFGVALILRLSEVTGA